MRRWQPVKPYMPKQVAQAVSDIPEVQKIFIRAAREQVQLKDNNSPEVYVFIDRAGIIPAFSFGRNPAGRQHIISRVIYLHTLSLPV